MDHPSAQLCPRQKREALEKLMLSPLAMRADQSRGRAVPESQCQLRTCFQRDVDRITHSKAFRRLKLKTQCFLRPEGDHYRTRLTHTLEVSRIARTIARALELNEDLAEAIALGHDLGHTPFGHAGERALNELLSQEGGFRHYEQSLRVVDVLEKDGAGLNLCWEVRDGILRHTNDPLAATLEGQAVRLADRIAYINHDFDDAVRAGILGDRDLPLEVAAYFGSTYSARINAMISEIVSYSRGKTVLSLSPQGKAIQDVYHEFMFDRVYRNPTAKAEESKVLGMLEGLYRYYQRNPGELPEEYAAIAQRDGLNRAVCDFISCMTDRYAVARYTQLFVPESWGVL